MSADKRTVAQTLDTPGYDGGGWEAATWDDGDHVHVLPLHDSIKHDEDIDGDCICGPRSEPCERDDGSMGWIFTHHAITVDYDGANYDGR